MENSLLIEITNKKALGLLHDLEDLKLIKILSEAENPKKINLKKAVSALKDDYLHDPDLTAMTVLDFEEFYEAR